MNKERYANVLNQNQLTLLEITINISINEIAPRPISVF